MRCMTIIGTVILALLAWSANAALITDTMDDVEAEVQARIVALEAVVHPTKDERISLKSYEKAMDAFTANSLSRKDDSQHIKRVAMIIFKVDEEDAAMMALLDDGLMGFADELDADLAWAKRKLDVCDPATNSKQASAAEAYDKAVLASEEVPLAEDAKAKAQAIKKFEARLRRAEKRTEAAFALEDLTTHEQTYLVDLVPYEGAETCIACHTTTGDEVLASGHWNWEGVSEGIEGHETEIHGKTDLINNFCIAIPTNEPRCTQCHAGYGWADDSFDRSDETKIDCLVCHDNTGTYAKGKKTAGNPEPWVDLLDVALNVGTPGRKNCGACHFGAGGGDNVKHGDLASTLVAPTRDMDVHMGTDGGNLTCQDCHITTDHMIAGMPLHSRGGGPVDCTDCHTGDIHTMGLLNDHTARVACQTCHIPAFSRALPTKTEWYWEDAGQDIDPIPVDEYGKPLYDKMKGTFVWSMDVVPELKWFNGKWNRMMINTNEEFSSTPVQLGTPVGDIADPTAKIYPFKKMVGNQPADAVHNTMLVPHLFGKIGGPNPYWVSYDWNLALEDGAAYTGQTYSGDYTFVETEMYLSVNHEIAPSGQARSCSSCHSATTGIDFIGLGYPSNPNPMP